LTAFAEASAALPHKLLTACTDAKAVLTAPKPCFAACGQSISACNAAVLMAGTCTPQYIALLLQEVFPACNVARMVELLPEGFLQQSQQSMVKRVAAINDALRGSLPGANIDMMVQEDPTILFEDKQSLSTGLRGLHDLWDVDEVALGNSNPWELALAIRAMSEKGPPNTV